MNDNQKIEKYLEGLFDDVRKIRIATEGNKPTLVETCWLCRNGVSDIQYFEGSKANVMTPKFCPNCGRRL